MLARAAHRAATAAVSATGGMARATPLAVGAGRRSLVSMQRARVGPRGLGLAPLPCVSSLPSILRRSLAAAATARKPLNEEQDQEQDSDLDPDGEAPSPAATFASLKGRISYDTLKALTVRPFAFSEMSEVQARVLGMMPELIGVAPKGPEQAETVEGETGVESADAPPSTKQDLLVKAKTGTGKTIAFLVPAIDARKHRLERELLVSPATGTRLTPHERGRVQREYARSAVGTLVISPTRELATQIANEARKLLTHEKEYEVQLLVGGESRRMQVRDWRRGRLDVVVATPGRLRDLLEDQTEDGEHFRKGLAETQTLVLDEADTLLEMGFSADLNFILSKLPPTPTRQTFLFSATVSPAIRQIAKASLARGHKVIDCVPANESNTHAHIPQFATVLASAADQLPHVLRVLAHDQLTNPFAAKAIVFLPTTKLTQLYATMIREMAGLLPMGRQTRVHEIHSKLEQRRRSRASDLFRQDTSGAAILVTSDVSARGVDYPGVTRVVQVNIPGTSEQYIHRVGRTGRGGSLNGRGDIVLLPWEAAWMKSQLREVPIQQTTSEELAKEVEAMAEEFDADPVAYAKARGFAPRQAAPTDRPGRRDGFKRKAPAFAAPSAYVPRLATIGQSVEDLVSSLDPEAVNEVFTSSLGYYISKSDALQASSMDIVRNLQDWAVEAAGQPERPHVSAGFLAKLGVRPDRPQRSGGGGGGGYGGRSGGFGVRSGGFGQRSGGFRARDDAGGEREPRRSSFGGGRAPFGGEGGRPSYGSARPSFSGGGERSSFGGSRDRPTFGGASSDRPRRTFDRRDKQ